MGFITVLTANNDYIHKLPEYPDLGDEIQSAILKLAVEKPVPIGHTGMTAHQSHHNDYGEAFLIGGGREALHLGGCAHYGDKDPELSVLKQLAEKHGFVLHKKRKR